MTAQQARQWVTLLAAQYRKHDLVQANYDAYTRVVQRYPYDGATEVLDALALRCTYLPTISEIGRAFAAAAEGAPLPPVAWEQVQLAAAYRPTWEDCYTCGGRGEDAANVLCTDCSGRGVNDTGTRPVVHPVAARAMESMGGTWAVRTADNPGMLRAQFVRAYDDFLATAYEVAALGRPWQAALAASTVARVAGQAALGSGG